MADLRKVVGAHKPDKARIWKPPPELGERIGGVAGSEPGLEVGNGDPGMPHQGARTRQAPLEWRHALDRLQRILRRHQPQAVVEIEPLQRLEADMKVASMSRIEGAAEEPDPSAGAARQRGRQREQWPQGRTCPLPRTTYLKLVSCSAPTGPRAWSLFVDMPISAPMPNSAPSANCVEALRSEE